MADIKQDQQLFFKGADRQTNIELASLEQGSYFDAHNMRQTSVVGNSGAMEKIKGEELFASVINDSRLATNQGYECIGACEVKGYKIAIYAHDTEPAFVQVNDMVVVYTPLLPFKASFPLQLDVNESCIGGEIFLSDFNSPTIIFNVQDLVDNVAGEKYFSEFNIDLYTVNLGKPLDSPVFSELVNVGITNGLEHGQYAYSFAYVDSTGNRTQFSQSTPMIPIVNRKSTESNVYKGSMTNGGLTGQKSTFGIKIKFRITNINNYSYVLIKRVRWVAGTSIGYVPVSESYQLPTQLLQGEISIAEFIDSSLIDWTNLSDEQDSTVMSAIKCNKAVRYFGNRLVLANIEYESKDIENNVTFTASSNGNTIFPFVDKIGKYGYTDIWNQVYRRQYQHGERYGFGFYGYDANGETSFVSPITGTCTNFYGGADTVVSQASSYLFPNRREALNADTLLHSVTRWLGTPYLPDILNTDRYTHEIFYSTNDTQQTNTTDHISIQNGYYNPLTPTDIDDINTSGHNYRINDGVFIAPFNQTDAGKLPYSINNFSPDIYATGIAVNGITDVPNWMKSFSIVRTKRANRVVAQGVATWKLNPPQNLRSKMDLGQYCTNHKSRTTIKFYSDDIDKLGIVITPTMKLQLVSPLGFSTQMYHADYVGAVVGVNNTKNRNIDIISHANIVNSNSGDPTTIGLYDSDGASSYKTIFGKWRNGLSDVNTVMGGQSANVKKFNILSINNVTDGRSSHYEIELSAPLYVHDTVICWDGVSTADSNNSDVMDFHEPFYIVNIIDENAELPDNNVNQYVNTGHYQKIESIIGKITNGVYFEFDLVDERFDDCIPNKYDPNVANVNTFIYIEDDITKQKKAWLNVQYKSTITVNGILDALTAAGDDGVIIGGTKIYGVYFSSWSSDNRSFSVIFKQDTTFSSYDVKYFIPSTDSIVIVKYDNRFPIKVFGGDSFIGDSVFCAYDGTCDNDGDIVEQTDIFFPLPHKGYAFNTNYDIMKNPNSIFDPIQNNRHIRLDTVRQWVIKYLSEGIANIPLYVKLTGTGSDCDTGIYQEYQMFPSTNYVMRPNDWDTNCKQNFESDGGKIDNSYLSDYPAEFGIWAYGGFKFNGRNNIDYSQYRSDKFFVSKPKVGYQEKTSFCSRIIWSNERVPNIQDSPNLKTFPATNIFDISDKNGAIKYLFDCQSDKGENLYAIADSGSCLLFTKKTLLSDLGGNQLGYIAATEGFVKGEYWISNDIGMDDEWWRSAGETSSSLIFGNSESIFVLSNNQITDIGRNKYYERIYSDLIQNVTDGYGTKIMSAIDNKHEQYWIGIGLSEYYFVVDKSLQVLAHSRKTPPVVGIDDIFVGLNSIIDLSIPSDWIIPEFYLYLYNDFEIGDTTYVRNSSENSSLVVYSPYPSTNVIAEIPAGDTWKLTKTSESTWSVIPNNSGNNVFVYSLTNGRWVGTYGYSYEKYITENNIVYGVRGLDINELDKGWTINGSPIECNVTCISSPVQYYGKEWRDIRINSTKKPTNVEFAGSYETLPECNLASVMNGNPNPYYLKNYNGYTNKIPRKFLTDNNRIQGRYMVYRISHNLQEEFVIVDVINDYVLLRLQ